MTVPPVDPKVGRFDAVERSLRWAVGVVAIAAVLASVDDPLQRASSVLVVAILIAVPLLRICWLVVRWFRRGDPKFALVGCGVLAVVMVGVILSR